MVAALMAGDLRRLGMLKAVWKGAEPGRDQTIISFVAVSPRSG
jgi:hypothetical protein